MNFAVKLYQRKAEEIIDDYAVPDSVKCEFAYQNFGREVIKWFTVMQNSKPEVLDDWHLLEKELNDRYGDPNRAYNAYVEWVELEMISTLDKYENKFDTLLSEMAAGDTPSKTVQVMHYMKGLRAELSTAVMDY